MNGHSNTRSRMVLSSRSSSPQSGPSTYSDNCELRSDVLRLHNLKEQLGEECEVLHHKKEALLQELNQPGKAHMNGNVSMSFSFPVSILLIHCKYCLVSLV